MKKPEQILYSRICFSKKGLGQVTKQNLNAMVKDEFVYFDLRERLISCF